MLRPRSGRHPLPESLEPSSAAPVDSIPPPSAVEPEAIGPREAVRGRVRDHPRQTVHPLGRRTKTPRSARLETLVTDLKPTTSSPKSDTAPAPGSNHEQLELDLSTDSDSTTPTEITTESTERPEPPSIATNPVAARRWAMTWKPDAETTDRNSQHPAARVTRENIDAATNQPSIPQVQSPRSDVGPTERADTLVTDDELGDELGETTVAMPKTLTPEPEAASEAVADAVAELETRSTGDTAADPEPIADEMPTPAIEPAPVTTEPDESDVVPKTAAVPAVNTPTRSTTERMPAPAASGAIRIAAAGWVVAVLVGLGWLVASNRPTILPPPAAGVAPAETPVSTKADTEAETESIMDLQAAIVDLEAMAASGAARISALETELEQARSDAAYLGRERSLLQAELEGLMEIIEPPATATNSTAAGG